MLRSFPNTDLKPDSQAAGRWETSAGGEYFAAGVGAAMTGRGADLLIIDDPHSEQDALSTVAYDNTYEWYTSGPDRDFNRGVPSSLCRQMVEEGSYGAISTEYGMDNMSDQWEVIEFPASSMINHYGPSFGKG